MLLKSDLDVQQTHFTICDNTNLAQQKVLITFRHLYLSTAPVKRNLEDFSYLDIIEFVTQNKTFMALFH